LENLDHLLDFSQAEILPAFSGTFRYETSFEWTEQAHRILLDLGKVFETVEVWVNGQSVGTRICPLYPLDIGGLVRVGKNILTIEGKGTKGFPFTVCTAGIRRFARTSPVVVLKKFYLIFNMGNKYLFIVSTNAC
jgi:hypothetical protein